MKQFLFSLACLFITLSAVAQPLRGVIVDTYGDAVTGAHVLNLKNGKHTHTDENGRFVLGDFETGDSIKFSHIAFSSVREKVTTNIKNYQVVLKDQSIDLSEIAIEPKLNALNVITEIDLKSNPVNTAQGILQQVPGLFIGQHAGGGKAEQIFLRGFDIDHGTDITIEVDGMPVNMVSHAHGQGYADLHFLIPETVDQIDFGKGPYYMSKGNFNTAGYVDFKTKNSLKNSLVRAEYGQFNTSRLLGMFKLVNNEQHDAYFAADFNTSDGPFNSSQNFSRINLMAKYNVQATANDKIGFTASHFTSRWDASGQIPVRAVEDGTIDRFGAIDDTEGGSTNRTNFLVDHQRILGPNASIQNKVFYSNYNFELFSNFTFFLEDSINGDQIKQFENRDILGFESQYQRRFDRDNVNGKWNGQLKIRNDRSTNNELSRTSNRRTLIEPIRKGDINETNISVAGGANINYKKWTFVPGLRLDYFDFQYLDQLAGDGGTESNQKAIVSPKLSVLYNLNTDVQFYLKGGKGFHSNDSRVVISETSNDILPAAYGSDLGVIWKPTNQLLINTAIWYLFLEQEFVYVGDAGIVEPSGRTRRQGIELSARYQPLEWLFLDFDANYTHARAIDEADGEDLIPLAPIFTTAIGASVQHPTGFYGGLNFKGITDRPANEDNSIVAEGYGVFDLNLGYEYKQFDFGLQIQNLFNTEWNETQFATESRLRNETESVEEIHFTPGTPFFIKGSIGYKF